MEIGENGRRSVASGGATHWSRRGCRWRTGESSSCANRACRTRNIPKSSASSELIERRSARRRRRKSNNDRFCSAFCAKIEGLRGVHELNKKLGPGQDVKAPFAVHQPGGGEDVEVGARLKRRRRNRTSNGERVDSVYAVRLRTVPLPLIAAWHCHKGEARGR